MTQAAAALSRSTIAWIALAWAAFLLMPWYIGGDGGALLSLVNPARSGLVLGASGAVWLLPLLVPLLVAARPLVGPLSRDAAGPWLVTAGILGLALLALQGFAVGISGWNAAWLQAALGSGPSQAGMGLGAALLAGALLMVLCHGLAALGWCRGDTFVVASIGAVVALIAVFVFFPVGRVLISAVQDNAGAFAPGEFVTKFADRSIWGLDCLTSSLRCGVAWNTLFLATLVGVGTTALGLAFALIATRTNFPLKRAMRVLSVLPIITPPFVIGLALILLFGRSGAVSGLLFEWFGIPRSRWIYGLPGVLIAQLLAFTPIAFLVLIGVVQGISPSLEEASQTLRAKRWTTFFTVTLPLMRPGLANAFLLGFVESMADFGNPLVLGGNFEVLSTKIFFAVVGAAQDQGRAAVLSLILLAFTLGAFWLQHAWLGRKVYTTVTGKGDSGLPLPLPRRVAIACYASALPWALFTVVIYVVIAMGGFVRAMGRDYTPTFQHLLTGFRVEMTDRGLYFAGSAWDSFFSTVKVAALAAPLTAAYRPAHRLSPHPPALLGPACLRVRHHAELRDPGHGGGRVLHPRLQRAAHRDHGHWLHPRDVLRVPQHAGGRARGHRHLEPDRQEPGRGLAHARRPLGHHHAPRGAAAAETRHRGVPRLQLRARHDSRERGDLPRHRRVQHGDDLHRGARGGGRVRPRDRLFHGAHRRDARRHRRHPGARGRTAARPARGSLSRAAGRRLMRLPHLLRPALKDRP
jgi:iron(III) transport system permease protein